MMATFSPALVGAFVAALAIAGAGCSRLSARSVPSPPPPLDIPVPPPRVVEAPDNEPPNPGTLVEAPAGNSPSSRRPPPRAEVTPKPEPPKPEPAPPIAETPPAEPPRPVTTLQTTPPEREAAVEKEIRERLERAARDLSRVDYRNLSREAQRQYDDAKSFATRAEEAIRGKNLLFARQLADNAATIAAQLAGR